MKLSLNWLNDYIDLKKIPAQEIANRLTLATCEVEGIEERFSFLDKVLAARVLSKEKHPNADRLSVCLVDAGKQGKLQIVCGAPNVQEGMWVALASIGAELPAKETKSGGFKIKPAKLRGVESRGMLCSPSELQFDELGIESEGLVDLLSILKESELSVGKPLSELLPLRDTILEIDNKSITHRPDLWCHFGFARELSAIFGLPIRYDPLEKFMDWSPAQKAAPSKSKRSGKPQKKGVTGRQSLVLPKGFPENLSYDPKLPAKKIQISEGAAHAYFGMGLSGIVLAPSPLAVRARLAAVGQRPINNIVDASNYLMFEAGQPNHAFDADSLQEDTVAVQFAGRDVPITSLRTLDGQERMVPENAILITDGAGKTTKAVALAGIMGAEGSEVQDTSTRLFLESATFPRERIRPAISATGLRTDSAQRFEKGQDPVKARPALLRLAELIAQSLPEQKIRFGKISGKMPTKKRETKISLDLDFLEKRLGLSLGLSKTTKILKNLNFQVKHKKTQKGVRLDIRVPSYRSWYDICIPEDIVEELGRIHGYDNIPPKAPAVELFSLASGPERKLQNAAKKFLSCQGFTEVYNYSFSSQEKNRDFLQEDWSAVKLANPVFGDRPFLRQSLLPGLLEQARNNRDRFDRVELFELGRIYYKTPDMKQRGDRQNPGDLALEKKMLSLVSLLPPFSRKLSLSDKKERQFQGYLKVRAVLEKLLSRLLSPKAKIELREAGPQNATGFHPGCLALLCPQPFGAAPSAEPRAIARVGLLHPLLEKRYELGRGAVLADLDFTALEQIHAELPDRSSYTPPSVFPASHFELSLLLDDAQGSHIPVEIIRRLAIPEITEILYLTEFRGESLPAGKRSVSYRLTCLKQDASISQEELQAILDRCVASLQEQGISLR